MLPRALLFASDEQATRLLTPILVELGLEIEECKEIFSAVEKLTTQSYQIVIADWTQELEASFFLKTARELKSRKTTFALAVVEEKDVDAALQLGVGGVINKPVNVDQAREALLAARNNVASASAAAQEPAPAPAPAPVPVESVSETAAAFAKIQQAHSEIAPPPASSPEPEVLSCSEDPQKELHHEMGPNNLAALSFSGYAREPEPESEPAGRRPSTKTLVIAFCVVVLASAIAGSWRLGYLSGDWFKSLQVSKLWAKKGTKNQAQNGSPAEPQGKEPAAAAPAQPSDYILSDYQFPAGSSKPSTATPALPQSETTDESTVDVRPKVMEPHAGAQVTPGTDEQQSAPATTEQNPADTTPSSSSAVEPPAVATPDAPPSSAAPAPVSQPPAAEPTPAHPEPSAPVTPPVERNAGNPEIPSSLGTPIQGTTLPGTIKTDSRPTKWNPDPIMVPEETSRFMLVRQIDPTYPEKALPSGLEGTVVLQAWVAKDGSVRDVKLVRGPFVFAQAAFEAVKNWRYQPYQVNGEVVEMQTMVTLNFKRPSANPTPAANSH
jgi:protein TonB